MNDYNRSQFGSWLLKELNKPGPVAPIAELSQVRQRLLRRPNLALNARQFVACVYMLRQCESENDRMHTDGDEESAVALALVRRKRHDAGQVVALERLFLLDFDTKIRTSIIIVIISSSSAAAASSPSPSPSPPPFSDL